MNKVVPHRPSLVALSLILSALLAGCGDADSAEADLVIMGGSVYSFGWAPPGPDGTPADDAPFDAAQGWHPDATAIAAAGSEIVFVGSDAEARAYVGDETRVIGLNGETVLPGLVDSHTHVAELGRGCSPGHHRRL